MRVRVVSIAQLEATEAAIWYDDRQAGLGDSFLEALQQGYRQISENGHNLPAVESYDGNNDVRRLVMKHFPYAIIFAIMAEEAVVIAVTHTRRKPLYWSSRL